MRVSRASFFGCGCDPDGSARQSTYHGQPVNNECLRDVEPRRRYSEGEITCEDTNNSLLGGAPKERNAKNIRPVGTRPRSRGRGEDRSRTRL